MFAGKVQDASEALDFVGVLLDSGAKEGISAPEAGVFREGFLPGLWRRWLKRPSRYDFFFTSCRFWGRSTRPVEASDFWTGDFGGGGGGTAVWEVATCGDAAAAGVGEGAACKAWYSRAILLRATSTAISGARVKVSRLSASRRISSPCRRKARLYRGAVSR